MSVEYLKSLRRQKKNQLNAYAKRRNSIRTIIGNINGKFNDDIYDVNSMASSSANNLTFGLMSAGNVNYIVSEINNAKEKSVNSDYYMFTSKSYLESEVSRLQFKINSLDREIQKLETQIKEQGGTICFWE